MRRMVLSLSFILALIAMCLPATAENDSQMRFCISSPPKTFDPLRVADDASETIRYLTGGVLIRVDRSSQQLVPELASSWRVDKAGKVISFSLRENVRFSDGTPFSAADVAYTVERLMDPELHSPTGDSFRSAPGKVQTHIADSHHISVTFPAPVVGLARLFDQVAILSAQSPQKFAAVLGPYYLAENKAGNYLILNRNPNYWKKDSSGRQLPYINSIRLEIQQNRDKELFRLMRGEIDLINSVNAEGFDLLKNHAPQMAIDAGVSLDSEQLWFNQVPRAPLSDYKKAWFKSARFRRAISAAINREDLARVVFHGHAEPAVSMISPANRLWFNKNLKPHAFDRKLALRELGQEGFRLQENVLRDAGGHVVEFSVVTNSGNKDRERMAAMIQQDLSAIGIRLNIVTLDFPSLIERITRSFNYEACLLGFVNDELDPNAQMAVWLSSADNHQWNPNQKAPATQWEAEIDHLMRDQASSLDPAKRKEDVDRVQQIVWEQEPFIYLVNKHALSAISPALRNARPVILRPQVYWNIDQLAFAPSRSAMRQ